MACVLVCRRSRDLRCQAVNAVQRSCCLQ